jgi:hypothetical protein
VARIIIPFAPESRKEFPWEKSNPGPHELNPALLGGICQEAPRRVNFSSGSLPLKLLTDVKRIHDGEALQPAWPPGGFIGLYQGNAW